MNYRHAFHAGNFADVHKHSVLARILHHLKEKPTAFRVIDTHAGAGLYDLTGPEANRTGEWREGVGQLRAAALPEEIRSLLAPYLSVLARFGPGAEPTTYPGSPLIVREMLRPQDRLLACEKEPGAARALTATLARDRRGKAIVIDGWTALSAYIPPKERRGLVLVDPPYEATDEFTRLTEGFASAYRKWPTGIFMLWYPLKDRQAPQQFAQAIGKLHIQKLLRAELEVAPQASGARLKGSGLIIANPPWRLHDELSVLQAFLAATLSPDGRGQTRLDWL
jgi:23S rRNA (adenine2030-N6)-methyltransferase